MLLPAGLTAILNDVAVADLLHTTILEHTVDVDAGTVYKSVRDAAPGADCPNTLIMLATYMPPCIKIIL